MWSSYLYRTDNKDYATMYQEICLGGECQIHKMNVDYKKAFQSLPVTAISIARNYLHYHRITEWLRLKGNSGGYVITFCCSSRLSTMSSKLLNIFTLSRCNLCQCLVTLTRKNCFLMFSRDPLWLSLCPLLLVLSL